MSLPRPIVAGATCMITRRCAQRQFLLLPSEMCKRVFAYCLAYAQDRTGMLIHAFEVLSNHYHGIVTDPEGRLPEFTYTLNKLVSKCMNAHYGRWENLWAPDQTSHVRLLDDEAKLEKTAYTMCNAVEAGLVRRGKAWPGFKVLKPGCFEVRRPEVFFAEDTQMPDTLTLTVTPLPLDCAPRPRDAMELVGRAIAGREKMLRAKRKEKGLGYLGIAGIFAQSHLDTPASHEPRRTMSPRIASRNKWRRIEALQRLATFVGDYRRALARWLAGDKNVQFPPGTYLLKKLFRVRCGCAPADT